MKKPLAITALALIALTGCTASTEAAPEKTRVTSSPAPSPTVTPDPTSLEEAIEAGMNLNGDPVQAIGVMEDLTMFAKDELKPFMTPADFTELTLFQFLATLEAIKDETSDSETIAAAEAYTYMVRHAAVENGVIEGPQGIYDR